MEFICKHCGKQYMYKKNLLAHERAHSGMQRFRCCGKGFGSKDELRRHRCSVHGDPKECVCVTCGKAFAAMSDLWNHQKRENNETSVTCEICGLKFLRRGLMRDHSSTHETDRKQICTICGARYKHAASLRRHTAKKHDTTAK